MRECTRCSAMEKEDSLGAALTHYVCVYCRKDGIKEFGFMKDEDRNSELEDDLGIDKAIES